MLAPIGAGGMGEVYRARDEKLNRDVALKILSAELASNADHLRRFQQEAHAASALNHPNIITIYDIGQVDGMAFIAMELVDGQDVRSLQAGERLPLKNVLRIATKVADGLAAAHERGIVHRDLKPENVMVSRDGFVKILDFGLAKLVRPITENQTTAPHTTPGAVFGTVAYMSPEQAAGRALDFRSDQFTLGVILYEMLTGHLPFSEETAPETLAAIIRQNPQNASTINEEVPPELERVVERCLAKDPAERYASTRDLARDLREIRDRISNSSDPRFRSDRQTSHARGRLTAIAAAVVIAAFIAIGTYFVRRDSRPAVAHRSPVSVAVLPFKDVAGTTESQIFADGVAEMIRSRLGESKAIRVLAPTERETPRDLGASYAVSGAVHRAGNDVQLGVTVTNVATGEQLASQTLTGTASDVFALQNRAANVVLTGLKVRPSTTEHSIPTELASAADQGAYTEALGLLQRARDEKSVDRAIDTLEKLLLNARDSAPVNAQLARGLLYKSQLSRRPGLIEQATLYAERAVEIDDSQPETHMRLGQLRIAAGRYADAETEFRRALEIRSDFADAYLGLADAYQSMGRAAAAESMYKKAIELRPNHANTYNRYAFFLFSSGRIRDAANNFRRSTELMPSPRSFNNLGAAYQALGDYKAARAAYEKSASLGGYSDVYGNLGLIDYLDGNYAGSARNLEKAVSLGSGSYPAWLALGDTYRWKGERDKSVAAYERAIAASRDAFAVNRSDAVARATDANALAKLGRQRESGDEINAALKLDPTNQVVLYDAAVVALLHGNSESAVDWLQRAVRAGYSVADLSRDPDFKTLRTDPSFPTHSASN